MNCDDPEYINFPSCCSCDEPAALRCPECGEFFCDECFGAASAEAWRPCPDCARTLGPPDLPMPMHTVIIHDEGRAAPAEQPRERQV
jgi:hypothetical protein